MKVSKKSIAYPKWFAVLVCFMLVGVVACGYGYAAVNSGVYISGEATVRKTGEEFKSTYMQDVTPEECTAVDFDVTTQMIDKRDGKKYWVAKMRDGSCWMTQDLKFDIVPDENGKIELTSELSDINPNDVDEKYYDYTEDANGKKTWYWNENSWLPPTETFTTNVDSKQVLNTTYSWNLGSWVVKNVNTDGSGQVWVIDEDEEGNLVEVYKPATNLPDGVTYDDETMTYNTHYLVGNYYQYDTLTAGGRKTRNHAISSICPKGWTIPQTPDYGNIFDEMSTLYDGDGPNQYSWPLYFSRGGYYLNRGLQDSANRSYYAESWFASRTSLYMLRGDYGNTWPAQVSTGYSFYGYTVRCVVRTD